MLTWLISSCSSAYTLEKVSIPTIPNQPTSFIEIPILPTQAPSPEVVCTEMADRFTYPPTSLEIPPNNFSRAFYFDSMAGDDRNNGTDPQNAWKSLEYLNSINFYPGDVIYLRRGSVWTGTLFAWGSGREGAPITYTSYGDSGPLPIFRNPGDQAHLTNAIRITGDWVVIDSVKVQEAQLAGVYIDENSDHNVVRNIEATMVGEGVSVHGRYNKIINNYIHDLNMVQNTKGGNDDYGAIGVWLFNSDNEVAYNRLINLRAPSYDYKEDGGAIEFYKEVNNAFIHHNYVNNAKGFMEIGGGSASDSIVAYNLVINSGKALGIHLDGKFASVVTNFRFENNTIVDTSSNGDSASINFWWASPTPEKVVVRNNIFYLKNYKSLVYGVSDGSEFTHDHNLFYLPNGDIGMIPGNGDIEADPMFQNISCGNFELSNDSPAIDSGLELGHQTDFIGNPVFFGTSPDIGAFEFRGTSN